MISLKKQYYAFISTKLFPVTIEVEAAMAFCITDFTFVVVMVYFPVFWATFFFIFFPLVLFLLFFVLL